ncbi:MAG: putative sigma-54 modulation protein [Parcubacteria group bacterium LiPW_72]|nr:MAG: putative sigma-54 modulation protein [Parcubacteria group bacterium LiPW_72]
MQIKIRAKNLNLDEKIKGYIEEKIGSLAKFLSDIQLARVEVAINKRHRKGNVFYAEVMLEIRGSHFYTKEEAQDLYAAIDICREEMIQEIRKFKTKMQDKRRGEERSWKRWIKVWRWRK